MKSKKCNCTFSRLTPHRASECTINKVRSKFQKHGEDVKSVKCVIAPPDLPDSDEIPKATDVSAVCSSIPTTSCSGIESELSEYSAAEGNEPCDCVTTILERHRVKNCLNRKCKRYWHKIQDIGVARPQPFILDINDGMDMEERSPKPESVIKDVQNQQFDKPKTI